MLYKSASCLVRAQNALCPSTPLSFAAHCVVLGVLGRAAPRSKAEEGFRSSLAALSRLYGLVASAKQGSNGLLQSLLPDNEILKKKNCLSVRV